MPLLKEARLHHHIIPTASANQRHRLVVAVHLESATSRGVATIFNAFTHALRNVGHHLRKIIGLRIAVADEQHTRMLLGKPY